MHQHTCLACGEPFDCLVENCTEDDDTAVCADCFADEDAGITNDYIEAPTDEDYEDEL